VCAHAPVSRCPPHWRKSHPQRRAQTTLTGRSTPQPGVSERRHANAALQGIDLQGHPDTWLSPGIDVDTSGMSTRHKPARLRADPPWKRRSIRAVPTHAGGCRLPDSLASGTAWVSVAGGRLSQPCAPRVPPRCNQDRDRRRPRRMQLARGCRFVGHEIKIETVPQCVAPATLQLEETGLNGNAFHAQTDGVRNGQRRLRPVQSPLAHSPYSVRTRPRPLPA
jgi:hypothetical protein